MTDWEKVKKEDWSFSFFIKGLKTLWELLRDEKKNIFIVTLLTIFITILRLLFPYFLKLIFDYIPQIADKRQVDGYTILLLIAIFFIGGFSLFFNHFIKEIKFLRSLIKLENLWPVIAQEKLLALSLGYHERENTGKKISKINKGCEKLVDIMGNLFWSLLPHLFYLVINMIFIIFMDWRLGLIFFIPLFIGALLNLRAYELFAADWEKWEEKKETSMGYFCQSILNVQTVQNYVQEESEKKQFSEIRRNMEKLDFAISKRLHRYFFMVGFLFHVGCVFTIAIGVLFVIYGKTTPGTVVYIIATGNVTVQSLTELTNIYMRIMRNFFAVFRMKELLDEEQDIKNSPDAIIPKKFTGRFEFKNVFFHYPDKGNFVLDNFNFMIEPNKMIALVSRSGEGKTTIVRLLCRMYDISKGKILLDGRDIKELDLYWYRKLFAIVQQDVDIFDASILENISYPYSNAPEADVIKAAQAAHLEDVIYDQERFPDGIHTQVGENGVRLSGGQRQRVGIARAYLALLNGAKVLILDEATSSLDSEAEKAIQEMIQELRKKLEITIIAIAHRLSTIQRSDWIYVIGRGNILEQGSHEKLMGRNGLYAKLVALQKLGELRQ